MTTVSLPAELAELRDRVAREGFDPHEPVIAEVVAAGREVRPDLIALAVLGDRHAPVPARSQALAALDRAWTDIHQSHVQRKRLAQVPGLTLSEVIDELFEIWKWHQDFRRTNPSLDELARSRFRLETVRRVVAQRRSAQVGRPAV